MGEKSTGMSDLLRSSSTSAADVAPLDLVGQGLGVNPSYVKGTTYPSVWNSDPSWERDYSFSQL
ncbi:hypothetical protein F511_07100 [Dorcoceras hygrometricum]|nr:hypothetical protein F511_07100 [Dorcoceras hygrometricum]